MHDCIKLIFVQLCTIIINISLITTSWGSAIPLTVHLAVSYSVSSLQTVVSYTAGVGGHCIERPVSRTDRHSSVCKSKIGWTLNFLCTKSVSVAYTQLDM